MLILSVDVKIESQSIMSISENTKDVLGFSLIKAKVCPPSQDFWYGMRYFSGKPVCVYIGSDVEKAKEKITAWCQEHGLEL